eukprot:1138860-Pelagomonas_calceolata.AAC.1
MRGVGEYAVVWQNLEVAGVASELMLTLLNSAQGFQSTFTQFGVVPGDNKLHGVRSLDRVNGNLHES